MALTVSDLGLAGLLPRRASNALAEQPLRRTDAPRIDFDGEIGGSQDILSTLVEAFGGEATISALVHRLSRRAAGLDPVVLRVKVRDQLRALARRGALWLDGEENGNLIARLTPAGAAIGA